MPRIENCDECGHAEFVHLYQTQICTESGCNCNGWIEEPYPKRMMEELSETLARMLEAGFRNP
jgi:hypothetical protein